MPPGVRRLSISAVGTYLECPRRFKYSYLDKVPRPESQVPEHWRMGSVVHKGLEVAYLSAVEQRLVGSMSAVIPQGMAAVRAEWVKLEMPERGGGLDRALEMVSSTLDKLVEHHENILGVEHLVLGNTPDGTPFVGYVDLVRRVNGETIEVRDYKVRAKTSRPEELATDYQGLMYAHFLTREHRWAKRVVFSHLYPNHGALLVQAEVETDRVVEAVEKTEAVAEMVLADGEFEPRAGDGCGYCAYTDICPAWAAQRGDATFKEMTEF